MGMLDSLSPLKVVQRGYSLTTKEGQLVKSVSQLAVGDKIEVRLADGEVTSQVLTVKSHQRSSP